MKLTLLFNSFFLFTISLCHFVYAMDCPSTVYVELGKDGIINCQILNNGDVYWYKGNSTKTSPIVKLENGQKKILQESNRYDIDEEGSLIIKKIEEQNYGLYSVVNFYANDKHETDQINVKIAVKPQAPCPVIAGCNDCNQCVLTEPEEGNISCSITGIRPLVHLSIVIDSKNNVQVIRSVSKETYNPMTDTWNTTETIEYSGSYDCTSLLQLRCVTESEDPLQLSDSVAKITSDSCKTTTQISGLQTPLLNETNRLNVFEIVIIIIIIVAVIVLVAFGLLILFCGKKAICGNGKGNTDCTEEGENTELLLSEQSQAFIDHLQREYKRNQEFSNTLISQCGSIDDFFTGISFTLKKKDGSSIVSPSDLIKELFGNEKTFVFIGDVDFGRTTFKKFICSRLSVENLGEKIMFSLNLSGLHNTMRIIDAMSTEMNSDEKFSAGALEEILDTRTSLFVFDSVQHLKTNNESPPKASKTTDIAELTINDFFTCSDLFKRFPKVHCLYLFNYIAKQTALCTEPHVLVKYTPFSSENMNEYITSVFKYYDKAAEKNIGENVGAVEGDHDSLSTVSGRPDFEQVTSCIRKLILDEQGIIKEMNICPPLLILFIHVLVSDITKTNINDLYFYVNRLTYLTRLIVSCLRFQHSQYQEEKDFNRLMVKLGQISYKNKLDQTSFANYEMISTFKRIEWEEMMDGYDFSRAYAIGILKLEGNGDFRNDPEEISAPDCKVTFRHYYIQEFLTANIIAADKTALKKFLESTSDIKNDRMKRVLQFVYAHEVDTRQKILEGFIKARKWNILIDCLFESEDEADFKAIHSKLRPRTTDLSVNIKDMDQHYHCMAVTKFCKYLTKYKISLAALTFRKSFKLDDFSPLKIHAVNFLAFIEMDIKDERDFTFFVKEACQLNVLESVQFVMCQCPKEVSKQANREILRNLKVPSSKTLEILQADTVPQDLEDTGVKWYRLNLDNGCWILR